MKKIKSLVPILLMIVLIFSLVEPSFADLSAEISPSTAQVGDTVTITITASNDELVSWYPVVISVHIPNGLKYLSHIVPDKTRQDYNSESGIWNVGRMRHDERGHLKVLIITAKVLPEAAGKSVHVDASFAKLIKEKSGVDITVNQPPARTDTLRIYAAAANNTGNGTGDGTGNGNGNGTGTGTGTGTGNGTGTGITNGTGTGKDKLSNILGNVTSPSNNPLLNSEGGGGGGSGKAYEVFNSTKQDTIPQDTFYGILAILAVIAIVAYGYYKEMKK